MKAIIINNKAESKTGVITKTFSKTNAIVWNSKRRFI